jgi:hypothetical protein
LVGFGFPKDPLDMLQPEIGVIVQFWGLILLHTPNASANEPFCDVFVKLTIVLMHAIVSGEIEKEAVGFIPVVIGQTGCGVIPHGF